MLSSVLFIIASALFVVISIAMILYTEKKTYRYGWMVVAIVNTIAVCLHVLILLRR